MKVQVDEDSCIGAGNCVSVAGRVFRQREADGISQVLLDEVPADAHEDVLEAESICPVRAIRVDGTA
jgi:ferredoxin